MTDYTIQTNFGAKDSLPSGNAAKVVKGSEFTTEFTNIATAVNSKANSAGDTFTGVVNFSDDIAVNTNTLFVDVSAAKVGIGTTSPAYELDVTGSAQLSGGDLVLRSDSDDVDTQYIRFENYPSDIRTAYIRADYTSQLAGGGTSLAFGANNHATETDTDSMVIDIEGNVLVGTTATPTDDNTALGFGVTSSGEVRASVNNGNAAMFKRASSDGDIIELRKDSSLVGSIGTSGSRPYFSNGVNDGIKISDDYVAPCNQTGADKDASLDLGSSSVRFKDIYLSGSGYFGTNVGIGTTSPDRPLDITDDTNDGTGGAVIHSYLPTLELDDISGGGTSFILQHDTTNTLFKHDSTERMRIDSSGRVDITAANYAYNSTNYHVRLVEDSGSVYFSNINGGLYLQAGGRYYGSSVYQLTDGATSMSSMVANQNGDISFYNATGATANGTVTPDLRMRIDSSGNVLVGKTNTNSTVIGCQLLPAGGIYSVRDGNLAAVFDRKTSNGGLVEFRKDGSGVGSISVTGSATAYNTSSDERLKENIADSADAGSKVDGIQIRQFDWKSDGSHQDYGVIAQELVGVAPEAVHQPEDSEEMMGVDYSKLVPMLIKEVQSLRSRVAELENA